MNLSTLLFIARSCNCLQKEWRDKDSLCFERLLCLEEGIFNNFGLVTLHA